ncbi:MAG: amidohydrolase, partial [Pseudomonadota bacterium]
EHGTQDLLLDSRLSLRAVKIYLDGALGSRGALLDSPYDDSPKNQGIQIWKESEFEELVRLIDSHGFQVAVHAIGNRANEIAVRVFEKVWGEKTKLKRPRIEHAQVLSEDLIRKMGKLGIIASMQPVHCSSDSSWVVDRIGKKRARFSYPWRTLLDTQVPLAFGTDSPIEDFTPWPGLFSSISRRSLNLSDANAFFPEEKINLKEALLAFSQGAAYASFQETMLGSLEPGKWADFFVSDKNLRELLPEELLKQEVQATYFSGRLVYTK